MWPRRITLDGIACHKLYPSGGIIAGSVPATYELMALLAPIVCALSVSDPRYALSIFVDDATGSAEDEDEEVAISIVSKGDLNLRMGT